MLISSEENMHSSTPRPKAGVVLVNKLEKLQASTLHLTNLDTTGQNSSMIKVQ